MDTRDAAALAYLGYYYAMAGNQKAAVEATQRAVTLAPHSPDVLLRAASTYIRLGDQKATIEWLRQAVAAGLSSSQFLDSPEFQPLKNDPEFRALTRK